jgi:hypothetical protein
MSPATPEPIRACPVRLTEIVVQRDLQGRPSLALASGEPLVAGMLVVVVDPGFALLCDNEATAAGLAVAEAEKDKFLADGGDKRFQDIRARLAEDYAEIAYQRLLAGKYQLRADQEIAALSSREVVDKWRQYAREAETQVSDHEHAAAIRRPQLEAERQNVQRALRKVLQLAEARHRGQYSAQAVETEQGPREAYRLAFCEAFRLRCLANAVTPEMIRQVVESLDMELPRPPEAQPSPAAAVSIP